MTRINSGVRARELVDRHLIAEHREIKRIPRLISKGKFSMKDQPKEFCLGPGHVKFFYDKCLYLLKRYQELRDECYRRGFQVQDWSGAWEGVPPHLMGDWEETESAREQIQSRINDRLSSMSGRSDH